jgi:hypothetical protein
MTFRIHRRHNREKCKSKNPYDTRCRCPLWVQFGWKKADTIFEGKKLTSPQTKWSLGTRSWSEAQSKKEENVGTDGTYPGFLGTIACSDKLVNVPSVPRFLPRPHVPASQHHQLDPFFTVEYYAFHAASLIIMLCWLYRHMKREIPRRDD